ncbi:hypothetical protein A3F66_01180 [candidate division TM6 bacterium RIFCSPHIGHO2_12_FULL_32_22]|nr:MAG: hypothetical protein A3F66_01180 [candidate division TM6 bacterium RIFCSPHIGHO2_12_FULL_32_22]
MKLSIIFISIIFSSFAADLSEHVLMNDQNRELLFKLANRFSDRVDERFSNKIQVICGLGQSPTYLIEALKLLDASRQRRDREYKFVAFSGNLFKKIEQTERPSKRTRIVQSDDAFKEFANINDYKFEFDWENFPTKRCCREYRKYLAKIGLSETDLVYSDKEFVLIDRCHYGLGIRSFLHIIKHYRKKPTIFFMHNYSTFTNQSPQSITLNKEEHDLMFALSYDGNSIKFQDRLSQLFKSYLWRTIDPAQFKPHDNALIILEALKKFHESKLLQSSKS